MRGNESTGEEALPDGDAADVKTGSGLGLVRLCMALLGGRYTLAATAGGGASAEVWLPTRGPESTPDVAESAAPRRRSGRSQRSGNPPEAAAGRSRSVARFLHPHWRPGGVARSAAPAPAKTRSARSR